MYARSHLLPRTHFLFAPTFIVKRTLCLCKSRNNAKRHASLPLCDGRFYGPDRCLPTCSILSFFFFALARLITRSVWTTLERILLVKRIADAPTTNRAIDLLFYMWWFTWQECRLALILIPLDAKRDQLGLSFTHNMYVVRAKRGFDSQLNIFGDRYAMENTGRYPGGEISGQRKCIAFEGKTSLPDIVTISHRAYSTLTIVLAFSIGDRYFLQRFTDYFRSLNWFSVPKVSTKFISKFGRTTSKRWRSGLLKIRTEHARDLSVRSLINKIGWTIVVFN